MESKIYPIGADADGLTVFDYLRRRLGYSSTLLKKVKASGIALNETPVTVRARLKTGDRLAVSFPRESSEHITPIRLPLEILYEDGDLLAVSKPGGIPTHPAKGTGMLTLANMVCAYLGEGIVFRAVNRLDTDTSGIVLIAKTPLAATALGEEMRRREIEKRYLALVEGIPEPRCGVIDAPIGRESEDSQRRTVRSDGQSAVTEYRVLSEQNGNAVCELRPRSGRTHQIRVHMAHIGHPLVGDFLYGTETPEGYRLVCTELSLRHPESGAPLTLRLPNPERLMKQERTEMAKSICKKEYHAPELSKLSIEKGDFLEKSSDKEIELPRVEF